MSTSGGKAAPDVDLRAQGGSERSFVVGGLIVVGLVVYNFVGPGPAAESIVKDGEEEAIQEAQWLTWVMWFFFRLLQIVVLGALILLGVLVTQQRKIIYVPAPPGTQRSPKENPRMYQSPDAWGLPYEDLMIETEDGTKVNAWLIYQPLSACKDQVPYTLVYFHGNAGNIGHRLENIRDMHDKLKVNILILDYRGYGDSEDGGGCTQKGFIMDALGTYRFLVESINSGKYAAKTKMSTDRILLFGRSIGGAVAIKVMADLLRESLDAGGKGALPLPAGLILENTFTALKDMAVQIFPFLSVLKWLLAPPLLYDPWDSTDSLAFLTKRHEHWCCCLLSGLQDEIVPPEQMTALHGILKTRRPKVLKFFRFPLGGHNDTPTKGGAEYWISFSKFMGEVVATEDERREGLKALTADGAAAAKANEGTSPETSKAD